MAKERQEDAVERWWHWVRPYWHVGSFLVLATFILATNWSKVQAYDNRIIALEGWQTDSAQKLASQGQDIAVMKQQVSDIHDYLIPRPRQDK